MFAYKIVGIMLSTFVAFFCVEVIMEGTLFGVCYNFFLLTMFSHLNKYFMKISKAWGPLALGHKFF
jgi:hypothetical protein